MPTTYADYDAFLEATSRKGVGDGLPLVPPTAELVHAMLDRTPLTSDTRLGEGSGGAPVTVEAVARWSVAAGCIPEYLPLVLAAVQAFFTGVEERLPTLSESAQVVMVNGAMRNKMDMNCQDACFGPGWRANATIGRALRLVVTDAFGIEHAAHFGSPAQYSFCFGEDEENSGWTPLHVDAGFDVLDSAVTVHSADSFKQGLDLSSGNNPEAIVESYVLFARGLAAGAPRFHGQPVTMLAIISQEMRRRLSGNMTKDEIRQRIFDGCSADDGTPYYPLDLASVSDVILVAAGGVAYPSGWSFLSLAHPATVRIETA